MFSVEVRKGGRKGKLVEKRERERGALNKGGFIQNCIISYSVFNFNLSQNQTAGTDSKHIPWLYSPRHTPQQHGYMSLVLHTIRLAFIHHA